MKKCLIVSGGDYTELPFNIPRTEYVIACDKGWQYAEKLKLIPDVIIGDFDSSEQPEDTLIPILRYPSEKDDTDTMLAIKYALQMGYDDLYVVFAFGGRGDHSYANIQAATYAAVHGAMVRLIGSKDIITVFSAGTIRLIKRDGWSVSVFAISDLCTGVSIRGTKYEVEGVNLTNSFPLGACNAWKAENAEISLTSGVLMVIESKLKPGEHN